MERYLYISPAIIALFIFIYMRNRQAKRNDKMRERLHKRQEELMQILSSQKDKTENKEDDNRL
ncbi:hypothetical protein [Ferruginibacter sp.]